MLSARAGDEARVDGLDAGADDYLVKPFSARELVARIETQLKARRQKQAAEEARAVAEEATRAKDEFMAMLGHELRNPLAPILTTLQVMKLRGDGIFEQERALIERQVRHVVRLVDDLLEVSRITRGKISLDHGYRRPGRDDRAGDRAGEPAAGAADAPSDGRRRRRA